MNLVTLNRGVGGTLLDRGTYVHTLLLIKTYFGSTELVITERVVTAKLGENVNLKCELVSKSKDVLQVTWQKTKGQFYENIATYSKRFGTKIADVFRDHVTVTQMETDISSITIRGIRKEDEACYNCMFNAYPEGAIIGRTCLSVYGNTTSKMFLFLFLYNLITWVTHCNCRYSGYQLYRQVSQSPKYKPNVTWIWV